MSGTEIPRAVRRVLAIEPSVAVIIAGLALALYLQGAFHGWAQLIVAMVLLGGVLLLPQAPVVTREDVPVALAAAGLAGWAVVDGVMKNQPAGGTRYALIIGGALLFAGACRQLRGGARTDLLGGLVVLSCLLATAGWVGVVGHWRPWGFESPGLWRASSTLTYPNATAVLLAVVGLVCLALRTRDPAARWFGVAATALITGMGATLSRAGVLGFAIGVVVLIVGLGWRPVARAALTPFAGAVVALAGLLPSITADEPSAVTVGLAVAGAVAGLAVGSRTVTPRLILLVPVAVVAIAVIVPHLGRLGSRFTVDSPDRWGSIVTAWRLFTEHPLTGVGPGLQHLVLDGARGTSVYRYAHNEYLQVLAELGVFGGVLLVAFVFVVIRRVHRSRGANVALGAGVSAGMAALVVHAGFDFVWHVPVVLLFAAALVGLAAQEPSGGVPQAPTETPDTEMERKN